MLDWLGSLLSDYGYWVVFGVVFLNNLCFPLPGDSVLLGAGFLVEKGTFSFWETVAAGATGAFLGCNGGYLIGLRYGRRLLRRIAWFRSKPQRVARVDRFFEDHGAKSVFFARFVALLHPVTGLFAGMGKTPLRPFLIYNLAGSLGYALLYTAAGHFFGRGWEPLKAWLGFNLFYAALILMALLVLAFVFRGPLRVFFGDLLGKKKGRRQGRRGQRGRTS